MTDNPKSGRRDLAVRLRTARKRTTAQQKWLSRQLNDPYVARARAEGWRSRAAFKLIEIDDRYKLLRKGQRIVDLGAAPGGWCQVAAERIGSTPADTRIVAIDLLEIEPIPGVDFLQLDFTLPEADAILKARLGGAADGVLSDMAANTTGHKKTDHLRIIGLAEMAAQFAREVLAPGGFFLCKLFQGGETGQLITELKRDFATVRHVKPAASRADSSELYLLATGFRG
ncbi:MAG: RlmE family RNA methyltransferase [Hyphomicrobiales bacterium]|uniref:RlmE family RNA methyltransferase n=1 Tax=Rhabdaerophilum calidifontis TaxID=2604328 RepID=UPI00123A2C19|nr:RlmE family RNA methyltransferase [Rhabdaerophilum calidifontis]MCA1951572.1 RlmE family RNA methyltransferase [Hyphomicrobiales bacterium]MCA1998657.1 RlmE family RNA methyltransferase [Hyphomicrobiales bacterium]